MIRFFLLASGFLFSAYAGKAQNLPANLREHLSLMHLGRVDSTYLQNVLPDENNWTILDKTTATRMPPTGIITQYSLHLAPFPKSAWLVEISHAYQHDGKRLALTYFDGKRYQPIAVPYLRLETMARQKLPVEQVEKLTKGHIFFFFRGNSIFCYYQAGADSSLRLSALATPQGAFAEIRLHAKRYQIHSL